MNETDKISEKTCNSVVFEDEAKVLTFATITTENILIAPLELGKVEINKVIAPENQKEASEMAKNIEKYKKEGTRVVMKDVAQRRKARGEKITQIEHKAIKTQSGEGINRSR